MMLSTKIQEAFNEQLNAELASSYLYLSMAAYFEAESLRGMAGWMRAQAREELGHAMKIYDFVNERDGRVTLTELAAPKTNWKGPLDAFQEALKHEQEVTARIYSLVDLSIQETDHAANTFLQWFISEQVEEEATVQTIVDQLKLVGEDGVAVFMLDRELGQRDSSAESAGTET